MQVNHSLELTAERKATGFNGIFRLKTQLGIFIAVFTFALYSQSISFDYAVDDYAVIKENNLVKQGIAAIPTILKTDFWFGLNDQSLRVPEYRPLPLIVFALEWHFFPDNPHIYHLVNVLLYSLVCTLLFLLLCKLFEKQNLVFPLICTILFSSHPIHTEVVDNIKSLDEILCFFFSILSILLYISSERKPSLPKQLLGTVFFFLSILSKETGITYLIITPLTLFVFTKVGNKKILFTTLSLIAASIIFFIIRFIVLESLPAGKVDALLTANQNTLVTAPDLITQKSTAFYILLKYIALLAFPFQLSFDYSIAQIPILKISNPWVILSILCYLTMAIYAIFNIRKKNIVAFAILFYLVTIAPVSNVFILIYCTMAERFLFMPSLGFCMILSFLLIKLVKADVYQRGFANMKEFIWRNSAIFSAVFIITILYSCRTISRNPVWKNNASLFSNDVKIVTNNARAHYNYGIELLFNLYPANKGTEKKNKLLVEAIKEFNKAISIYPDFPKAYFYAGLAYENMEDFTRAISNFERAINMFHPLAPPYVFCELGGVYAKTGQYDKALSILDSSIKYYPDYTDAYIKKGFTYLNAGKNTEALNECNLALSLDIKNTTAHLYKGCAYMNLQDYRSAIDHFNIVLEIDSTNLDCLHSLNKTYQNMKDTLNANEILKKINLLTPTN